MAWAVNHPDRISAVVSMAGATYPWEGELDAFNARLAHSIKGPIIARLISAWASADYVADSIEGVFAPQSAPSGYGAHIGVPMILNPNSLIANAQQRHDLRPQVQALHSKYSDLDLPVEIVHGDADITVACTCIPRAWSTTSKGPIWWSCPALVTCPNTSVTPRL